jgi:integrase
MAGKEKAPGVITPLRLRDATFICHTLVTAAEEAVNVEAPAEKKAKPRRWRADKGGVYENPQSAYLWLDYRTPAGKRVRESSRVKVAPKKLREAIQKAKDILAQRFESIGLGVDSTIGKGLRYEDIRKDLLDRYEARGFRSLKQKLNKETGKKEPTVWGMIHLDKFFAAWKVSAITQAAIRAFVETRKKDGAEGATINRNVGLLQSMFRTARRSGKLQTIPEFPEQQKVNPPRQGYCTPEQFLLIRSHLPENLWPLLTLLYYTGVRIGEAKKIMWSYDGFPQVDLKKEQITLLGMLTKNGQPRVLPLTDELVDMLKKQSETDGPVFDSTNFRKEFAAAKAKAKCAHVLIHDFRRSAVSNLVNVGTSETDTMQISGHRSRTVFDRYNVRNTTRLHDAMSRVEKSHSLVTVRKRNTRKSLKARSSVG